MKAVSLQMALAVVVNTLSNAVLIPRYGAMGAAISGCLSNGILAMSSLFWVRRIIRFDISLKDVIPILTRTIYITILLAILDYLLDFKNLIDLIATILIATVFYLTLDWNDKKYSMLRIF
jgi:O-antigen/teichoic acid export membrane protein